MNFFASTQKSEGRETLENMEGEEERGIVGEENSQKDAAADETSRQKERSQTPQLGSDRGSDDDDDKEDEREEQTSGSLWGHTRLPPSVYGNNPPSGGKRMGKANAVWEVVKHLKERTTDGVVVDAKYSHVCISPINAAEAGEQGPDVDSHGNSLWFCNKLFSLSKQKTAIGRVRPRSTVASFMGRHQQRARPSVNEPQRTTRTREMSWRRLRIRQDPRIRQPRIRQVRAAVQPRQDRALEQPLSTPSLTKNCVWGRWLVGE